MYINIPCIAIIRHHSTCPLQYSPSNNSALVPAGQSSSFKAANATHISEEDAQAVQWWSHVAAVGEYSAIKAGAAGYCAAG